MIPILKKGRFGATERRRQQPFFSLSTKAEAGNVMLGDTFLKWKDQQTYLDLIFDKWLTWKQHIASFEGKARRKLNIMRNLAGTDGGRGRGNEKS